MKNNQNKTVILYTEWALLLKGQSDSDIGKLFNCILNYANDKQSSCENPVWNFIKHKIDENENKREDFLIKQRENGKKGGRPIKNPSLSKETQKTQALNEETQKSLKVKVKVKENVNKNIKNNLPPLTPPNTPPPLLGFIEDINFKILMDELIEHRKSIKKPFPTIHAIEIMYNKLMRLSGGDIELARQIVDDTIAGGYQNIYPTQKRIIKNLGQNESIFDYNMRMTKERIKKFEMEEATNVEQETI